jgi:germination protein YpeB
MILSRRNAVLLFSYVGAAFLVLTGFLIQIRSETAGYRYQNELKYQHAFSELVSVVSEIDMSLQKSLYATSPSMVSSACTDVFGKALMAKMAMSELPFAKYRLEETSGFLTKVGDYSYCLSKNSSGGNGYTEEEYKNLITISQVASILSQNLLSLQADINDGKISMKELSSSSSKLGSMDDSVIPESLGQSFSLIESEFPEVPTLIYDGPFSQHINLREPKALGNLDEIDNNAALKAAAEFTGLRPNVFKQDGDSDGSIPQYCFNADVDGGSLRVCVTKKGGKIFSMLNSRSVSTTDLSAQDAIKAAKTFLDERGYTSMKESYWTLNGKIITINFAYVQDGVICYPDLLKVSVALDNGRIVGFESRGYLMNHTKRTIPAPAVTKEEALKKVADSLTVLSHDMAVIPTPGMNEVFCHEFKCESEDGRHYIIYVNAATGNEENILVLIEDENGTLAM